MRIKDLDLPEEQVKKLKDVLDMEIDDFLHMVDVKAEKKIKINKPYIRLYDFIVDNYPKIVSSQEQSVSEQQEDVSKETASLLKDIPADELKTYYDEYLIDKLKTGKCKNLLDIYNKTDRDLLLIPHVGGAMYKKLRAIRDSLRSNPNYYIDEWTVANTLCQLPSNYDRSLGLNANLTNAFTEFAQIVCDNLDNKRYIKTPQQRRTYSLLADVLTRIYNDGASTKEIAEEKGVTPQRIEQVKNDCISEILKGEKFFYNYILNQDLLDLIGSVGEECLYAPIQQYYDYSGSTELSRLGGLGYDTTNIEGLEILIPKDTKGICYKVWRVILNVMCENPLPTDRNVIEQLILDHKDLAKIDYDIRFIEFILSSDYFVDNKGDNLIQIKNRFLSHNAQRMARIVFEADDKLTTKEVMKRFEEIYKYSPTANNISDANKYGICCQGKKFWYYGEPKIPLQQWVTEFAEEKEIFYYSELEEAAIKAGYTILSAIRAYITNVCASDCKDNDHFCLKDCVDQYKKYKWRAGKSYGWANWLYNEIKKILAKKGSLPVSDMIDELDARSQKTEYKKVRQRIQYNNMADYCGVDKPFIVTNGIVGINKSVYDKTDFELIGLRGVKYPFFRQIRSLVANELKKEDTKSKKIVDIVKKVQDEIDEPLNRGTIIRALKDEQQRFSSKDFDVVNENGVLIVKLLKKDDDVEPVFVASAANTDTDTIELVETKKKDDRPSIKYRQKIEFDQLNTMLKHELAFYSKWMQFENIDLDQAVDLFIGFIQKAKNPNIKEQLPQDLYEYWFARTDSYDRYKYFTDLTIMFEALLKEIYYQNNGTELQFMHGITQLAGEFTGLPLLLLRSRDAKGFNRIAGELVLKRNKVAHGDFIEMNSFETAQAITELVALYVYIVSKYSNKTNVKTSV